MKALRSLAVAAALAIGGCGMTDGGPDIEKIVQASPAQTFEGFSLVLDQGEDVSGLPGAAPHTELDVDKVQDKSIDWRLTQQGLGVIRLNMRFEPMDGGAATRVITDVELDALPPEPGQPQMRPAPGAERRVSEAVGAVMDQVAAAIESGDTTQLAAWRGGGEMGFSGHYETDPAYERARDMEAQREASAPTMEAEGESIEGISVEGETVSESDFSSSDY